MSWVFNEQGLKVTERSKTKNTKLCTSGLVTEGRWGQTQVCLALDAAPPRRGKGRWEPSEEATAETGPAATNWRGGAVSRGLKAGLGLGVHTTGAPEERGMTVVQHIESPRTEISETFAVCRRTLDCVLSSSRRLFVQQFAARGMKVALGRESPERPEVR